MEMDKNKIMRTTSYAKFKKVLGNRLVSEKHVKELVRSIKEVGWYTNPIIVNENMEIIDGQHRYEALRQLGMPIEYVQVDNAGVNGCIALNKTSKNWKASDYIRMYALNGNPDYVLLQNLSEKYAKLTNATNIAKIISGDVMAGGGGVTITKRIQEGTFKAMITGIAADMVLGWINSCMSNVDFKGNKTAMIAALSFCRTCPGTNIDRLRERFELDCRKFGEVSTIRYAIECLEDAYNRRLAIESRVRFGELYENYCQRNSARYKREERLKNDG